MKIRVKINGIRKTVTCKNGAETTLEELKHIIATCFEYLADEAKNLELSLNGKDKLEEDDKRLSEFGLVSGDLVFVLQDGRQSEKEPQSQANSNSLNPENSSHDDRMAEHSRSYRFGSMVEAGNNNVCSSQAASTSEDSGKDSNSASNNMDIYIHEEMVYDPAVVNKCLQQPLLCRESNETTVPATLQTLYQNTQCANTTDALWIVIHTLMLEAGFVSVSQSTVQDKCCMPDDWKTSNHYEILYYHVELTTNITCKLIGVCMGSKLIIHGKIFTDCQSKVVQLKVDDFISSLKSDAVSTYKNLHCLSIIIKDRIALPLLQDVNRALGLPAFFGFLGLNFELKLKILSYLDCVSLLRVGEVCKQLNSLYKDPYLWRILHLKTFGGLSTDLSQNWYEMYKLEYKNRKEKRKQMQQMNFIIPEIDRHRPRPFQPFSPVFPHHGIIGGDYDLNPHFHGIPDPLARRHNRSVPQMMRPRYDPLHPLPGPEDPLLPGEAGRRASSNNGGHWLGSAMGKRFF